MTHIYYKSTRDAKRVVTASQAILQGISQEGGLFVPVEMPNIHLDWEQLKSATYQEVAQLILKAFFTDFTDEEIAKCVAAAYDEKFTHSAIAPVKSLDKHVSILELFHGNTIAFKDMALSILPHLMQVAMKKQNIDREIVILTATSGDTGKAAMAGFSGVKGTKIVVFYPDGGVSEIQKQQMVTQVGDNVKVVAVKGNFDDAQSQVKEMFNDMELKQEIEQLGYQFSSANSINIGRLIPQVVYYVYAYAQLLQQEKIQIGDPIRFVVPTGNFGNILAGYYAKKIGVPIDKLVCASNENNVLVDFFATGHYDKRRPFYLTTSPSMDILVSSNLERLIYEISQENAQLTQDYMTQLKTKGDYQIETHMHQLLTDFVAFDATQTQVSEAIKSVYNRYHYVIDPHTAVAYVAYEKLSAQEQEGNSNLQTVILSTANPYKFPRSVMNAFSSQNRPEHDFDLVQKLYDLTQLSIPQAVVEAMNAPVLHREVVSIDEMPTTVVEFLKK